MPDKQKQEPVSLLHLPDELLLQVMEDLDRRDLYALSIQCKRLHHLFLPPYLRRLGVTTPLIFPIDHLRISREQLSAPGIPFAFFAKNIRRFSCEISSVRWRKTLALQRLCALIANIEGLEDLALHFRYWYFKPVTNWDPATAACIHLLEVAAERCSSLKLSHAGYTIQMWMPFNVDLLEKEAIKWRSRSQPQGPFKTLRRRFSLGISRSRSSDVAEIQPHPPYALKTLILESNMFFVLPFSGWAFETMNTVPLTRLDLIEVKLSSHVSGLIFGAISIPTLKHLRIVFCLFEFNAFAAFLSRHNTISTLDIISSDVHKLPKRTLPALVSLKSNSNNIVRLLTPSAAFPKLAHICVVVHLLPDDQFTFDAVEPSFAPAATRLTGTHIRLCLEVLLGVPVLRDRGFVNLQSLPNDLTNYPVMRHVREIAFGLSYAEVVAISAIPTWLSLFPLLEHIEFLNTLIVLDHEAKMDLLRRIAEKCAGIRTVKIDDDTRDVAVWLSSDS